MTHSITFKNYEKAIYSSLWADGLIDVFAGASLLVVGITWMAGFAVLGAGVGGVAALLYPLARKRWVETRTGAFQLTDSRQSMERRKLLGMAVAGIGALGLLLMMLSGAPQQVLLRTLSPAIPSLIIAFMCLCAAIMLALWRFVAYGLLMIGLGSVGILADVDPAVQLLCGGVAVFLFGIVRFARFLGRNPVVEQ